MSFPCTLHPVDPSDLHLLISTNIPPTINQQLSLQMALTHCTSNIASLYQTLDNCKKMHLRLHWEIVTAEKDIGSIKAIMHPVHVLPPELLREIFMYRRKAGFNVCVSTTDNLWRWMQVCCQWCKVCLSIPSLWSDVRLNFVLSVTLHLSVTPSSRHALHVLDTHMFHTSVCLIDVTIVAHGIHIAGHPLLEYILCRCWQWCSFSMDALITVWCLLDVCAGSLGDVNSLIVNDSSSMSIVSSIPTPPSIPIISAFSFIPNLRSLALADVPLQSFTILPTTFLNLEVFKVHLYNQLTTVFDLLLHMISVSSLDITCDANVGDFDGVVELPSVMSLTLHDGGTPPSIARHVVNHAS
ncbi:hypothetical protein EV421DRAFT_2001340 [Armillaria borealis]|uniref:F-box domain-containing protein n=1 Tax=Armillaria borealis TaxID=47425 RepID=A0AA39IXD5_9AGAR|nr:hypothetical protein EV421DRAFT_2001340 [Armillaria borealis]